MSAPRQRIVAAPVAPDEFLPIDVMTPQEARAAFDATAQRRLGLSGSEFLRRWQAGEYRDDADQPGLQDVVMLLPLGAHRETGKLRVRGMTKKKH